jgi:hypothetical protein
MPADFCGWPRDFAPGPAVLRAFPRDRLKFIAACRRLRCLPEEVVMKRSTGLGSALGLGFVLVGLLWLAAPAASADSDSGFRCGARLVNTGDHMAEVREKCGDPDLVTTRVAKRTQKQKIRRWSPEGIAEEFTEEREIEVLLDEWVYDFGEKRFMRYVGFENNRVVDIQTGNRGSVRR